MSDTCQGFLNLYEPHPAAFAAKDWLAAIPIARLLQYQSSFASVTLSGNRLAEICSETLRRLLKGEPVSDRYLLGLAWLIKQMEEKL